MGAILHEVVTPDMVVRQYTAVGVRPLGSELAREIGNSALKAKGEQPQAIAGKYVVIWQKVGSALTLATEIGNISK
jgi:hypothetical protein